MSGRQITSVRPWAGGNLVSEKPTFWFVWTKTGRIPRFTHHTEEAARREADRLARANPGKKYIVLQAIEKVQWRPKGQEPAVEAVADVEGSTGE